MNLLAGTFYDPTGAAAVTKSAAALLAMTALDTTNLRLVFTVPLSGRVLVKVNGGAIAGAATWPQILVGVLEGATVRARIVAALAPAGTAVASTQVGVQAEFVVTGLTPGASLTWDLAYGVEVIVAATGWKYGGPNSNAAANDAFGGISFSIWDPSPIFTPSSMPTATVHAKLDTIAGYIDTEVAAILAAIDTEVAAIKVKTDQMVFTIANKLDCSIQAAADFAQTAADKVWSTAVRLLTAGTNIVLAKGVGVTGFTDLSAAQVNAEVDAALDTAIPGAPTANSINARLDAAVSSRLSSAGYTAPDNAGITTLTGRLTAPRATALDNLDATVSSRLASGTIAADVTAIRTKTDSIVVAAGKVEVQVKGFDALSLNATVFTTTALDAIATQLLDLAGAIETGMTLREAMRACVAILAGEVTGAGSGTESFAAALANHKTRVTVSADADGNRSSVVFDLT